MKRLTSFKKTDGAAAVEFAIILPLMLTLVFGMIECSIMFFNKAMLTNASREGARTGIVYDFPNRIDDSEINNVVNNYCGTHLISFGSPPGAPTTTITRSGTGTASGDDLTVTVQYHYDYLVLHTFIPALSGGTDLVAKTVMRLE